MNAFSIGAVDDGIVSNPIPISDRTLGLSPHQSTKFRNERHLVLTPGHQIMPLVTPAHRFDKVLFVLVARH